MVSKIKYIYRIIAVLLQDIKYTLSFLKKYDEDQEVIFSKLRTCVHALDKGVNLQPFEKGHSKEVYKKSLLLRAKITNEKIHSDKSFHWACSVIEEYENKQIGDINNINKNTQDYQFNKTEKDLFYSIIKKRTSCRNYTDKKISDNIWNEIIGIAAEAPSGCCRQSSRYYIENNPLVIKELIKNIAGASGFSSKIPYLICVTSDIRSYEIRDRHLPIIDTSLNIENFILACAANNIATTALNWQHATFKQEKKARKYLNIPKYEKIILFIAAGYPKIIPSKPKRIDLKWIRKK